MMPTPCTKQPYLSKKDARAALNEIQRLGRFRPWRKEKRAYYCPHCAAWHLTSKASSRA